jgi:hypothetical protein
VCLFHLPQPMAAHELGVSLSALKTVCRRLEIMRWPYQRRFFQCTDRLGSSPPRDSGSSSLPSATGGAANSHARNSDAVQMRAFFAGGSACLPSFSRSRPYPAPTGPSAASAHAQAAELTAGGPARRCGEMVMEVSEIGRQDQRANAPHTMQSRGSEHDNLASSSRSVSGPMQRNAHLCLSGGAGPETFTCVGSGAVYGGGCSGTSASTGGGGAGSSDGGTGGGTGSEDASEDGSDDCSNSLNPCSSNNSRKQSGQGGSQSPGTGSQSQASGSGTPECVDLPHELDFDTVLHHLGRDGASKLSVYQLARDATACIDEW